jgi:formiminotetrahydrofolate cyclodeaminase
VSLANNSLRHLLEGLSSPNPTPGGGAASAIAGAMGASLLAMVAGMPKTRSASDEDRAALDPAREALLRLRNELVELADLETAAHNGVMTAYRLPTETEEQKTTRDAAIQEGIRNATDVPLQTLRASLAVLPLARTVAEHGNPSAKSDILVAMSLAMTGWSGGVANVTANLEYIHDEAYIAFVKQELTRVREVAGQEILPTYQALGISGHGYGGASGRAGLD